ncbi:hypothetical protein IEJ02_26680 [Streptomyces sp. 5-10]|nr:hypothetical protein [Streptomyces sp. 5-10]
MVTPSSCVWERLVRRFAFHGLGNFRRRGWTGPLPRIRMCWTETHKNYRTALGDGYDYEVTLPSGRRPDAIDWENRVVRELKSDSPSSMATGRRQLKGYVEELEEMTGQSWTGHLDIYKRFD